MGKTVFDDILPEVENQIQDVFSDTVKGGFLKDFVHDVTEENVYRFYIPQVYERRYTDGGLQDPSNYEITQTGPLSMTVENMTVGNGKYAERNDDFITDIIESGVGYTWEHSIIHMMEPYPRPFMQTLVDRYTDEYLLPTIHAVVFND